MAAGVRQRRGAPLTAIAVNEPSLLFDPQKLATRARRKGSHYLLSEKCLVLRGLEASRLIVAAKTDEGLRCSWWKPPPRASSDVPSRRWD